MTYHKLHIIFLHFYGLYKNNLNLNFNIKYF